MSDGAAFVALVVAFAVCVTAHVGILFGLARRTPRWRAAAALVVVPLALYWAVRAKMYVRAAAWVVGIVAYVALRLR
jgi:hypothetical protein